MNVLLTGAFGNIGESTLLALFEKNYNISCFDLKSERNAKIAKRLHKKGKFETIWGDILDFPLVESVIEEMDCIIHLAGIIPPLSESKPDLTRAVNIEGTKNVVGALENRKVKPKLVFASSVSVFGPTMHLPPPRTAQDPIIATDVYTETKIECERIIKESGIPWTILRFAAAPPSEIGSEIDTIFFDLPLNQRIEFVHSRDVGLACANAVDADTIGKTLLIGGGKANQMIQRDFISQLFENMGIGMLPDSAFRVATKPEEYFYTDWLDTEESQRLLQYQTRSFVDYMEELKAQLGIKRYLAKLLRGQAQKRLLEASPYYRKE